MGGLENNLDYIDSEFENLEQEITYTTNLINVYKELINLVLRVEDIYKESTQKELIEYQNSKINTMVLQKKLIREKEFLLYKKRILIAENDYQILSLYEELLNQKVYAEDESLFLTSEEKKILLDDLKEKLKTVKFKKDFQLNTDSEIDFLIN